MLSDKTSNCKIWTYEDASGQKDDEKAYFEHSVNETVYCETV